MGREEHLDRLRQLSRNVVESTAQRDQAIREARTAGLSLREMARATGLSHVTIRNLTKEPK